MADFNNDPIENFLEANYKSQKLFSNQACEHDEVEEYLDNLYCLNCGVNVTDDLDPMFDRDGRE